MLVYGYFILFYFFLKKKHLIKPSHASTLLQNQKFNLGDRVVFVKDTGSVPIASKGTIVGIEKNNIDVVFDASFMSGSPLGDRLVIYYILLLFYLKL